MTGGHDCIFHIKSQASRNAKLIKSGIWPPEVGLLPWTAPPLHISYELMKAEYL